jgi:hypothetical protein
MTSENNAAEEKNYYNSESEGKEYKIEEHIHATYEDYKASPFYAPEEYGTWQTQSEETFINTCEETFGEKNCHEETYIQEEGTSDQ